MVRVIAVLLAILLMGCSGGGVSSGAGNPSPLSGAPTGLSAAAPTSTSVSLTWQSANRFSSYRIYRNDAEIAQASSASYVDSGLSPATPYRYFVRGVTASGLSEPSNTVTVTTPNMLRLTTARLADEARRSYLMIRDVEFDASGNLFVAGGAFAADFPTTVGAFDRTLASGGSSPGTAGPSDAFVMKFSRSGALIWSTLIGGPNYDRAYALEIARDGGVIIAGRAGEGFPTTTGVVQPNFAGDSAPNAAYGRQDGFVAKLSSDGSALLWSTFIGDAKSGFLRDIGVDDAGRVYAAGAFFSGFPHITPNAAQSAARGAHDLAYVRLSADARRIEFGTFLGGVEPAGATPGTPSIVVTPSHEVYVAIEEGGSGAPTTPGAFQQRVAGGEDFLIAKFSQTDALSYATYLGGSADETLETHNIAADAAGRLAIAAVSSSSDYPTMQSAYQPMFGGGASDGVISILSADGSRLVASTYFGGTGREDLQGIGFAPDGLLYVSGGSTSSALRTTSNAAQGNFAGVEDAFLAAFSLDLSGAPYLSYLGGSGEDIARTLSIGADGRIGLGGHTASHNFPVSAGGSTVPIGAYTGWIAAITP